ncbi:hypothetical protein LJR153_007375 [Paenibacillus sp. LjRoot153]|uniref:hypothetical protein n=1 Tax=Paenibacillus sp. LjRoot153 TaxID=3342270 RepID=UPI003ED08331
MSRTNLQETPFFAILAKSLLGVMEKNILQKDSRISIKELAIEVYGLVIKLLAITIVGFDHTKMDIETNIILKETMDEVGHIQYEPLRSAVLICECGLK